jgi:hypothetical protein
MPITEAWRRIWRHDEFIGEPDSLDLPPPAIALAAE